MIPNRWNPMTKWMNRIYFIGTIRNFALRDSKYILRQIVLRNFKNAYLQLWLTSCTYSGHPLAWFRTQYSHLKPLQQYRIWVILFGLQLNQWRLLEFLKVKLPSKKLFWSTQDLKIILNLMELWNRNWHHLYLLDICIRRWFQFQ